MLRGSQARIALGIHPRYVSGACLGGRIGCHKDCSGDSVLLDVPEITLDWGS